MTRTRKLRLRLELGVVEDAIGLHPSSPLHSTTFSGLPPTSHVCNYCNNAIPNTSVLPLGCGPQPRPEGLTDSAGEIIICACCGTCLKNKGDWSRHLTNIHENVGKWFFCALCGLRAERELCNLASHMKTHFRKYKMTCTEPLPSGGLCALEFDTPKEWHKHRKHRHGVELDPYLYTTSFRRGKECRNLEATHPESDLWAFMAEFSKGFPEEQARWVWTRLPPMLKSFKQFSPDGWPYFVAVLTWVDLQHPSIRANLLQIQSRHNHIYCIKELEAIEANCAHTSSHSTLSSSPYTFPTYLPRIASSSSSSSLSSTPPLVFTPISPATAYSDLGEHPTVNPQDFKDVDLKCDTTSPHPESPLSSVYGQPFLSSPLLPSSGSSPEQRCNYYDSSRGHRYEPYAVSYRNYRSPELPTRSRMRARSPHSYCLRPAHFSPRKEYRHTEWSACPRPLYSPFPSESPLSPSFSSPLRRRGVAYIEDDYVSQGSPQSSPAQTQYRGYTPETLAKSSAYFRTVLAEDSE